MTAVITGVPASVTGSIMRIRHGDNEDHRCAPILPLIASQLNWDLSQPNVGNDVSRSRYNLRPLAVLPTRRDILEVRIVGRVLR